MHVYHLGNNVRAIPLKPRFVCLRDYAAKLGFKVVKIFIDEQSATNPGRKYFGEMVEYFRRNRACLTLIVEKVDRLYRNNRDPITIEDLNIEVHFVKDNEVISKDYTLGRAIHP